MSTLPDFKLTDEDVWVDLYTALSIPPGTPLVIQNKNSRPVLVQYVDSQPTEGSKGGFILFDDGDYLEVGPSIPKVWISGSGNVSIQHAQDFKYESEHVQYDSMGGFGDRIIQELVPIVQISATYSDMSKVSTTTSSGGSATIANGMFQCSSGTNAAGIGAIHGLKLAAYHPGQPLISRFSAIFDTPVANTRQYAGLSTATDSLSFGYNGTQFGIIHRKDGAVEVRTLTVTTPAGGAENATVTLNGTAYTVALTAGTTAHNARQIAESLKLQTSTFRFTQNGSTVVIRSVIAAPYSGTWSFSSAAAVASFARTTTGVVPTDVWYYQADWNGRVPYGFNPQKGNVYQIQMQYLGVGNIHFYIEDSLTSRLTRVHTIRYTNNNTTPSISTPSFRVGWTAANVGNTSNITVKGVCAAVMLEGQKFFNKPQSISSSKSGVGSTGTHILSIRSREVYSGKVNLINLHTLKIYGYTDSTKGVVLNIIKNATLTGYNYTYLDSSGSIVEYDTSSTAVSGGTVISTFLLGSVSTVPFDLGEILDTLNPSETLTITARVISGTASEVGVSLIWQEDF